MNDAQRNRIIDYISRDDVVAANIEPYWTGEAGLTCHLEDGGKLSIFIKLDGADSVCEYPPLQSRPMTISDLFE